MTRLNCRRRRGFTLPELLVSCLLISVISLALVSIFSQASGSTNLSSSRMNLSTKIVNGIRRIQPFITSAFAPSSSDSTIHFPLNSGTVSTPANPINQVIFTSTEDFLAEGYPSSGTSSRFWSSDLVAQPMNNPINHNLFLYRVKFYEPIDVVSGRAQGDPAPGSLPANRSLYGEVWFERAQTTNDRHIYPMTSDVTNTTLFTACMTNATANTPDTWFGTPSRRIPIIRGDKDAVLESFWFSRPDKNVIQVNATMRGFRREANGATRGRTAVGSGRSSRYRNNNLFNGAVFTDLQTYIKIAAETARK